MKNDGCGRALWRVPWQVLWRPAPPTYPPHAGRSRSRLGAALQYRVKAPCCNALLLTSARRRSCSGAGSAPPSPAARSSAASASLTAHRGVMSTNSADEAWASTGPSRAASASPPMAPGSCCSSCTGEAREEDGVNRPRQAPGVAAPGSPATSPGSPAQSPGSPAQSPDPHLDSVHQALACQQVLPHLHVHRHPQVCAGGGRGAHALQPHPQHAHAGRGRQAAAQQLARGRRQVCRLGLHRRSGRERSGLLRGAAGQGLPNAPGELPSFVHCRPPRGSQEAHACLTSGARQSRAVRNRSTTRRSSSVQQQQGALSP